MRLLAPLKPRKSLTARRARSPMSKAVETANKRRLTQKRKKPPEIVPFPLLLTLFFASVFICVYLRLQLG